MMTPTQVAKLANVSVNTVRNYGRDFAELLSLDARGENGPRLYNDSDVETICTIAALRNSGVPVAEIAERIRNQEVPPVIDMAATAPLQEPPTELQAPSETAFALQAVQSSLQTRLEAVERRLEGRAKQAEWYAWLNGVTFGLALATVLLVLLWLLVNGGV